MNDIVLTNIEREDLELIRGWRNNEDVSKYMYTSDNISSEQQRNWFQMVQTDTTQKYWMITYQGKKLGVAFLYSIKPSHQTCYWAFYLGDVSIRGAGIGSKVEYNIISYVFDQMNFNKLSCEVLVHNDKVILMHEKFGFRRESFFREHIYKDERFHDVIGLGLLKRDWDNLKEYHKHKIYGNHDGIATQ